MPDNIKEIVKKHKNLPLWISLAIIILLVGSYFIIPSFHQQVNEGFQVLMSKDKQRAEAWVKQFGLWGPAIIIITMTLQAFLLFIPNFLLMIVAVICYGPWWGSLISIFAVLGASTAGYYTGIYLGPYALKKLIGEKTQKSIQNWLHRYGIGVVAVIRTSPILPNDALHFVAGLLRMGFLRYILATVAGTLPLVILIAVFTGEESMDKAILWISVISTILFLIYVLVDFIIRKRKRQTMRLTGYENDQNNVSR
ncbi:TVP38/TMEM64 family protein [Arcticibacter tournemirensis]|uniref:TVP38/TMEM64 family membrane protein n=1 Tax=Arcticibacter tournemirensis TaxID=699437 RepID=A0A4Q0M9C1_9SPHI|nr:TVP38/TMEM64 family protein [Arcticibacter tournemirensis]RXF69798.1 TVP38/TMEM64 family protein [Arcticibacter tournemirensis]